MVRRMSPPFRHQRVPRVLANGGRDNRLWIVNIAEQASTGRTGQHTRRFTLALGARGVMDAVHAQRAFGHHLAFLVEFTHAIRAGPGTVFAADAFVGVDQNDTVFGAFVARAGRAHRYAGRVFAMQAGLWEVHRLRARVFADLEGLHAIEKCAGRFVTIGVEVGQGPCRARSVPLLAAGHTGMATHTHIEVDDQRELCHCERSLFPSWFMISSTHRGPQKKPASVAESPQCRVPAAPARIAAR